MRRPLALLALAVLALAPAAASARTAEHVATIPNPSAVREFAGIVAWTQRDADGFHLIVRRPGAAPARPSASPFVFDLGSDTRGRPQVVYERDGDLYAWSLTHTTGERPIRNATTFDHRETTPTLWRGRLAFTRITPGGRPVVSTKTMTAPRARPSRRLPGVPVRGGSTSQRVVEALELHGRHLAQVVRYVEPEQVGFSETELRLVDLRGGVRAVARMSSGEGGQRFVGPSFTPGRLWWATSCLGDPSGCRFGAHRARTVDLAVERTADGRGLDGFAAAPAASAGGDDAWVVDAEGSDEAGDDLPGRGFAVEQRTLAGWAPRR